MKNTKKASEDIFNNNGNSDSTDDIEIFLETFNSLSNIVNLLMYSNIIESKSEIRSLIEQNGISTNNYKWFILLIKRRMVR